MHSSKLWQMFEKSERKKNKSMTREIPLNTVRRSNRHVGHVAIVDDEDYEWLNQYRWTFSRAAHLGPDGGYAYTTIRGSGEAKRVSMQNLIMSPPDRLIVDHKDGNALNNCRSNLRLATVAQNLANRKVMRNNKTGFKGVRFDRQKGKYSAGLRVKTFDTPEEAARMYDKLAKVAFGEFARLNFPD